MNKYILSFIALTIASIVFFNSCKKGAGEGGKATISGKIYAYNYNATLKADSGFVGDYKVFINYGDETGISNDVSTDYSGKFNFNYLRKGKYTVWVYTKKTTLYVLDSSITKSIEITDKNQTVDVGTLFVNTRKN
jgi:hypothetical protein